MSTFQPKHIILKLGNIKNDLNIDISLFFFKDENQHRPFHII